MSQDLDELPLYDLIIDPEKPNYLTGQWRDSLATLWQTLKGYLTQYGILVPPVTTANRNKIRQSFQGVANVASAPIAGQMIYNSDRKTIQVYLNGGWQEVTTTPAP